MWRMRSCSLTYAASARPTLMILHSDEKSAKLRDEWLKAPSAAVTPGLARYREICNLICSRARRKNAGRILMLSFAWLCGCLHTAAVGWMPPRTYGVLFPCLSYLSFCHFVTLSLNLRCRPAVSLSAPPWPSHLQMLLFSSLLQSPLPLNQRPSLGKQWRCLGKKPFSCSHIWPCFSPRRPREERISRPVLASKLDLSIDPTQRSRLQRRPRLCEHAHLVARRVRLARGFPRVQAVSLFSGVPRSPPQKSSSICEEP